MKYLFTSESVSEGHPDKVADQISDAILDQLLANAPQSIVDRSAAYAARHIAKNMVAAGVCDEMLVQLSYAIGVAEPVNINVNTYCSNHTKYSDEELADIIAEMFDCRPKAIEERLKLRFPIYEETASYGHMGRRPRHLKKHFHNQYEGDKDIEVELFTWEKLDYVEQIKEKLGL